MDVERIAKTVPGVSSALAERLTGGRYIDVDIDRAEAARYGMNIGDVQSAVANLIGGENIGETIEGLARYPISVNGATPLTSSPHCPSSGPTATRSRSAWWPRSGSPTARRC